MSERVENPQDVEKNVEKDHADHSPAGNAEPRPVLKGDFAAGERTLPPAPEGPDFARGERTVQPKPEKPHDA